MKTEILIEDLKDFHVYYTVMPADQLTPVQTLGGSIEQVNSSIVEHGRTISLWPEYKQNEIARLMWVNWIANNLKSEPVRKPILVHRDCEQLVVDCGDTRIMAATVIDRNVNLPVITSCRPDSAELYQTWTRILSNCQLFKILNFDTNHAKVLVENSLPNLDHAFDWMEISDSSTAHHWHNETQRRDTIQNYLSQQSDTFYFTKEWVSKPINWNALH